MLNQAGIVSHEQEFLNGGGEMGELIRNYDWSSNPLGHPSHWPDSLKTIVRIMLTSQQPIWIGWGKDLIKLYNDPYKSIVGGKHPWALGQPASIVWKDIWNAVGPRLDRVVRTNEGTYDEALLLVMERNGYPEETYYTFSYSPVPDASGNIGGIFCANTDDTQRIIGERQLSLLRDLASNILNAKSLDEIYTKSIESISGNPKDLPFSMIYMFDENEKALELVGASGITKGHPAAPESINLEQDKIWPFDQLTSNSQSLVLVDLKNKFESLPTGFWDQSPSQAAIFPIAQSGNKGKHGFLITGLNPLRVFDESYKGFINLIAGQIAACISNFQTLEEERKRAKALAEIDKAKTVFFSNISHEFRTPLTLMLGPMEDAINDPNTIPENQVRIKTAHRNALRLLKLVNSLLDFSRIEAGRVQAVFQKTDISQFTNDLSSAFRSIIEHAGITYNVSCSNINESMYLDTTMWERIVFNLLSNAYKFTFKGEISLSLRQVENHVELIVKDTGTGIPDIELPKLFSRFHRIEKAKGRTHEGSGIGLAMVFELVKLHGGSIQVESELGKGSTFTVSIPVGKDHLSFDQVAEENYIGKPTLNALPNLEEELGVFVQENFNNEKLSNFLSESNERKEKILLADDNPDMREYLVRLLNKDYDIKAVSDGLEALKTIKGEKPSLILSDIMMPNLDGLGLLKELRSNEDTKMIPVIFISARAGEEATVEGIEAGADDYLVKPFSAKELFARVQTNLGMSKLRKEAQKQISAERQHLYDLFMQAPAIIAVFRGPEHIFELANPRYMQLIGNDRDILGKTVREGLPEIAGQGFFELLDNVYRTGIAYVGNETSVKLDRNDNGNLQEVFLNFVYQPSLDADGKVNGILVHAVDVTEQVLIRRAIEESEEKYRTLFESMDQGFCIADVLYNSEGKPVDYKFIEINPMFEKQTGLKNAVGKTARELVPNLEDYWINIYGKVVETGEPIKFAEESPAQNRWYDVYAFRLGGNHSRRVAILFSDITERKKFEEDLKIKNDQLSKINNDLDNFIYTASHDLKAPVSNIEGLINSMKDSLKVEYPEFKEETDMILSLVDKSILRFKNTIHDLTEISKVQKSIEEDTTEELNCYKVIEDVKLMIHDQIIESDAEINYETSNCQTIKYSRKNFKSIVYNLLSNAIKYRDPERPVKIFIRVKMKDGQVQLSVQDNGLGISKENKPKLFTMFKRFHDHVEGSGVGLYIVKRIVDNAGGKIEVDSEVGVGTTFRIDL